MDTTGIGIALIVCWIFTGVFIIPVTVALELMVCQFGKWKWLHGIPVLAGVAISGPAMYMVLGLGMTTPDGFPFVWIVFAVALVISLIGTRIGYQISQKISKGGSG